MGCMQWMAFLELFFGNIGYPLLYVFLPSGAISTVLGLFVGGGTPSTQEVIEKAFAKQKKFIEDQFAKQAQLINEQTEAIKGFITQTELESVKTKTLGLLDALESRYSFILSYENLGTCLDDGVINEITQRVEYFMDQSDASSIKHVFDIYCPRVLKQVEYSNVQELCGFFLYSHLIIEKKRNEILTIMLSLLANSEEYKELSYGYLTVQDHQKKAMTDWITTTVGVKDTFCGLFYYHLDVWEGHEEHMEEALSLISNADPSLNVKNICGGLGNCRH